MSIYDLYRLCFFLGGFVWFIGIPSSNIIKSSVSVGLLDWTSELVRIRSTLP